jgi:hypothetical protein
MSSEQAPWVKVGVYVRRKASGFLHSRGEIVAVDGGLGVRCPTNHAVKRDDDIASSWIPCDSNLMNPKIGQAEWIKEGTDVRFLGGGQPGTIVKVPGGLAVRYGGDRALVWSGNIAESWAPCADGDLQQTGPATPSEPTRIEQAAWVKAGVSVLRRGCGNAGPRTIGVVVESQNGLAVRYEGCEDLWSGDITSSWEPIEGVVPVAAEPISSHRRGPGRNATRSTWMPVTQETFYAWS